MNIKEFLPPELWEEPIKIVIQPPHTPSKNRPKNDPTRQIVRMRMYPDVRKPGTKKARRREPPRVPTARKLKARDSFTKTQHCLEQSPYNEQHAYWLLAQGTGFSSFNYWTHIHLPRIHRFGLTCQDISRPHTFVTDPEQAGSFPLVHLYYPRNEDIYLRFEAILDPGTYVPNQGSRYASCPYYVWDRMYFNPFGYAETGWVIRPFVNKQNYNLDLFLPHGESYNPFYFRRIEFRKQIAELDRTCILWRFEVMNAWGECTYNVRAFLGPDGVGSV